MAQKNPIKQTKILFILYFFKVDVGIVMQNIITFFVLS